MDVIDIRTHMVECATCKKLFPPDEEVREAMALFDLTVKDFKIMCADCTDGFIRNMTRGLRED